MLRGWAWGFHVAWLCRELESSSDMMRDAQSVLGSAFPALAGGARHIIRGKWQPRGEDR
jgi:hypothetical protein